MWCPVTAPGPGHARPPRSQDRKDPDAPLEEVPARPSVRDRAGRAAGGRRRLRRLPRGHRGPRLLSGGGRQRQGGGPERAGRREAGRQRHPAAVRRHPRGPVPRPGLRPGAGPLLGDGRPAAHHRRPALRDVRRRPGRHRHLHPDHGLAAGGAEGVRHQAVAGDQEVPAGLLGRRERLALRAPRRREGLAGVRPARRRQQRLPARAVEPGGLGGLAQGDGLEPLREPPGGDRPLAADPGLRPGQDRRAVPGLPVLPQRHHREDRHGQR